MSFSPRIRKKIVRWIKGNLKQPGLSGIVLGLSGGVDSACAAALCKEAAGKNKVLALILPCHSHIQDLRDAGLAAKTLEIKTETVDLSGIYDNLIKILTPANRVASANLKPRLRMAVLYYFANKLNYLVCGTGNKSELMAGYFTKFGDGAVDIMPLADLSKAKVRQLAEELGVPQRIIDKPPSAGLWPGQTDEGEMGISYRELDDILERLQAKQKQIAPRAKVNKVKQMVRRSAHKRQGPGICYI